LINFNIAALKFDTNGLIPAVIQSATTNKVLMVAWMSSASLEKSLELGETVFFSRSRNELWHKGATSGNTQRIISIRTDCDNDTLLIQVESAGPSCHTGADSCFEAHDAN
jgi:phosphoribosyl-ATP pyrophosphohydrolase/phosphoribosyl-AMP cyclohydrolase